jgi:hypothetical protein
MFMGKGKLFYVEMKLTRKCIFKDGWLWSKTRMWVVITFVW